MFSELSLLLSLDLILNAQHLKWQLFTTHIGDLSPLQVAWSHFHHPKHLFPFHLLISPLHHFPFLLCSCISLYHSVFSLLPFIFYVLHFYPSSSKSPYNCALFLPSKSEPSHLLNHLVEFVSNGNLLWVSHHILLKTKTHKQSATHKICNFKINSH